ncbi:MAG: hypothetical protein ACOWWM_18465 [Desulfobacterales bacterium]
MTAIERIIVSPGKSGIFKAAWEVSSRLGITLESISGHVVESLKTSDALLILTDGPPTTDQIELQLLANEHCPQWRRLDIRKDKDTTLVGLIRLWLMELEKPAKVLYLDGPMKEELTLKTGLVLEYPLAE